MKKLLFLLLASFLVLAACGQEESKSEGNKETKSTDKESKKDDKKSKDDKKEKLNKEDTDEQQTSNTDGNQQEVNIEQQTQEFVSQAPIESQERVNNQEQETVQAPVESQEQATIEQEPQKQKIDLNQFPGGDFSTEGMSESAQKQIEELSRQKDYEGLPQKEYNDQVSEIMNNEMN
ncbi:hypothetical protein [Staphylococcus xylosus]|uniref:hypothetical protein n=1 Tax=Staphylococcus xylosus TaxID=1288 RepID=UPI003F5668D8